jgi:hypothetical protein
MDILEFFLNDVWAATILVFVTIGIAMFASLNVKFTFSKYSKVHSAKGLPAHIIARQILDSNGLHNVAIESVRGHLTDHYDPRYNVVRLSEATYNSTAVSAIGVAAHECGHAMQFASFYLPVKVRSAIFPLMNIVNRTWMFIAMLGIFMVIPEIIYVGLIAYASVAVFQFVTLPVEFDASRRALHTIEGQGILDYNEITGARRTLNAAAMTYVAALMVSIAQVIRILAIINRRR